MHMRRAQHSTAGVVAFAVLLNAVVTIGSVGSVGLWPVDHDVVSRIRSVVEGNTQFSVQFSVEDGKTQNRHKTKKPPNLTDGLQHVLCNLGSKVMGGSGWHVCEIDTIDTKGMTKVDFQAHHAQKVSCGTSNIPSA